MFCHEGAKSLRFILSLSPQRFYLKKNTLKKLSDFVSLWQKRNPCPLQSQFCPLHLFLPFKASNVKIPLTKKLTDNQIIKINNYENDIKNYK